MSSEWDAARYHDVSEPQFRWGLAVLARLELRGDEQAIDAGCGSGRLTAELLDRVPRGRAIAVDRSIGMLDKAREHLGPRYGSRIAFLQADLAWLPLRAAADVVFSTATFHWIHDHERLFACLFAALRPGGLLEAQCGGGPNLVRIQRRAHDLMTDPRFASYFTGWRDATYYASPEETAARLERAGFVDVATNLEPAPATFANAPAFAAFITTVVMRLHVARLPNDLGRAFIDRLVDLAADDDPPFTLDYWRLNLRGRASKTTSGVFFRNA